MYKFSVFLECDANLNALKKTIESLTNVVGFEKCSEIAMLFNKQKYMIAPEVLRCIESLSIVDTQLFFNLNDVCVMDDLNLYIDNCESDVLFFAREGDLFDRYCFVYISRFFEANYEKCGIVFIPALENNESELNEFFNNIPSAGLSIPDEYFPTETRGAAVWTKYACNNRCNDKLGYDVFKDMFLGIAENKNLYGRLNKVRIWDSEPNRVKSKKVKDVKKESYKYQASCIIPIYNIDKYLNETIESIITQSIGFEENLQLILVNDGSLDNCDDICKSYLDKYPHNIVYIQQENQGVSAARNAGLSVAEGEYIAFIDGDDLIGENYIYTGIEFLREHENEIDFVAFPLDLFYEVKDGDVHPLDFKFVDSKVININEHPEYLQLHIASTLIKHKAIKNMRFDVKLKYGEDIEFLHRLLMKKMCYGISVDSALAYRKRSDSAIGQSLNAVDWYNKLFYLPEMLVTESINNLNYISEYTKNCIMYDLQWYKFSEVPNEIAELVDMNLLRISAKKILKYIDNDMIEAARYLSYWQKLHLLNLKNGMGYLSLFDHKSVRVLLNCIEEYNSVITINGSCHLPDFENYTLFILYDDNKYIISYKLYKKEYFLGEIVHNQGFFSFSFPFTKTGNIEMYIDVCGEGIYPVVINFSSICRMRNKSGSFILGERTLILKTPHTYALYVLPLSHDHLSALVHKRITKKEDPGDDGRLLREYLDMYNVMSKKRIWLFMDRRDKADDNAEYLFRYCAGFNDGVEKYFIIDASSQDFERLNKYGKVIEYGSYEHKFLLLFAEKYIASNFDRIYQYPYNNKGYEELLTSISKPQFVFLQHGITKDDMSPVLNLWHKNIKVFVTSASKEYDSILEEDYGYCENVVKLTGLPRYDYLSNKQKKQIVFAPTWRKELSVGIACDKYNPAFQYTDYWRKIKCFLNNVNLVNAIEDLGYELLFRPHPVVYVQSKDFLFDERVVIIPNSEPYQNMLSEAALLITDYSSIAFDFAYMHKPVIYWQFDNNNWKAGYFNYQTMGFGEVVTEQNELIEKIIEILKKDCLMDEIYKQRVENFFTYFDSDNCKRVYEAIL